MAYSSMSPNATALLAEAGFQTFPDSWSVTTLGTLLADDRGISVGVMYPGDHDPAGVPLVKAADLAGNVIRPQPDFRISPAKHAEYRRTELIGGELLISLVGEIGRCAVVPPSMRGWNAARAIAVLRFADANDAGFVRICLLSPPLQHLMRAWATTTVQATLNLKEIRQLPLPWPPVEQRDAIVRTIAGLDDKIGLSRRTNRTLESIARAIFKSWFVDFDPVNEKMEGKTGGERGRSPEPWPAVPFSETVEILSGGTPSTSEVSYWGGSIPWYSVADAPSPGDVFVAQTEKTVTGEGIDNSAAQIVPELTTIISARGTVGRCALTGRDMAFNQSCFGLLPSDHVGYYFTYFSTLRIVDELQQSAHGSVFSTITRPTFASVNVAQPPAVLVAAFEARVRPLMMRIRSNVDESRTLQMTRDSLLPRLVSGELADGVTYSRGGNGEGS